MGVTFRCCLRPSYSSIFAFRRQGRKALKNTLDKMHSEWLKSVRARTDDSLTPSGGRPTLSPGRWPFLPSCMRPGKEVHTHLRPWHGYAVRPLTDSALPKKKDNPELDCYGARSSYIKNDRIAAAQIRTSLNKVELKKNKGNQITFFFFFFNLFAIFYFCCRFGCSNSVAACKS
jgi:hypothetical protein